MPLLHRRRYRRTWDYARMNTKCLFCRAKTSAYDCLACAQMRWGTVDSCLYCRIGFCLRCCAAIERKDWATDKDNCYVYCPFCKEDGLREWEIKLAWIPSASSVTKKILKICNICQLEGDTICQRCGLVPEDPAGGYFVSWDFSSFQCFDCELELKRDRKWQKNVSFVVRKNQEDNTLCAMNASKSLTKPHIVSPFVCFANVLPT